MSEDADVDNSTQSADKFNIDDLADKAKIVAQATGRSEEDVLADLLDDGIVNNSHKENQKDLVTQLKEAAELITTVQAINKDVSENTVLNGGENKTEVQIETTLEGDIVDRAIASVHRKAENIKKIALILLPVFLLVTGGTMTNMGVFESDESEGGENYECEPIWSYDDNSYAEGNMIYIVFTFYDEAECGIELEGHFISYIFRDGEDSNFDAKHHNTGYFTDRIDESYEFSNLEEGIYWTFTEFHSIDCEDGVCDHKTDEWQSPYKPYFTIENQECVSNTELDNPTLIVYENDLIVDLVFSDLGNCGQDIQIKLEIWNGGDNYMIPYNTVKSMMGYIGLSLMATL